MANLTITVDEATLKRARLRALEEDTSVNRVLAAYLEEYAGRRREAREAAARISRDARRGGTGSGGRVPRREDVYEERVERYPGA
ncbi:Hypothetical Protein RradSPS_2998 (plasmid) [Rubrobacter radiotolerans]|uniref:Ribbon-helix-helix protein, copG family n=1 Tax=Rubrobacter radiotolerans TaxID=42256 RepID=A0A023X7T7_RUBRA|nr:hypothetical protein [Rubrobacter radiotolerans]AHY48281.1 Hypothetical Protein RradSPS_2998 [Rubrobacter radiotolerans]MDX5895554.1 hypothetical protein [Rubrobacter radiotolerans]SMC01478.1 conserved hypothetical protein [Rubrobacter radiotolerans DSM 5868]